MRLSGMLLFLCAALAAPVSSASELKPWDRFFDSIGGTFSGEKLWLHAAAVGSTAVLVTSGADGALFEGIRDQPRRDSFTRPGVSFGGWAPWALGGPLLLHGIARSNSESLGAAYAVAQSTAIALGYITLLKALTGRPDADVDNPLSGQEQSRRWRFGFLRGGVYNGWPSGHVGTTTAVVSSLMHYYPDQRWLKWIGYPVIGYMVAAITLHGRGQMHWLSEAVAGALMGYAIGWTVGSNLRGSLEDGTERPSEDAAALSPLIAPGPGIRFSLTF